MPPVEAIILIDHGSAHEPANAALERLARQVADRTGVATYPAHMTLAAPTLGEAIAAAAGAGARRMVVCPMFLTAGLHSRRDIPRLLAEARQAHPDLELVAIDPLGADAAVAEWVARHVGPSLQAGTGT